MPARSARHDSGRARSAWCEAATRGARPSILNARTRSLCGASMPALGSRAAGRKDPGVVQEELETAKNELSADDIEIERVAGDADREIDVYLFQHRQDARRQQPHHYDR